VRDEALIWSSRLTKERADRIAITCGEGDLVVRADWYDKNLISDPLEKVCSSVVEGILAIVVFIMFLSALLLAATIYSQVGNAAVSVLSWR
jgi:hypothetical protein